MVVHILFLPVSFRLPEVYFEAQGGGDGCMLVADSCCCISETNKTLYSNVLQSKIKTQHLGSLKE